MNEFILYEAVPIPFGWVKLKDNDALTLKEVRQLQKLDFAAEECNEELGITNTYDLLSDKRFSKVKSVMDKHVAKFKTDVLGIENDFKMIGSWATRNVKGGTHHQHMHSNSMLSVVWYFNHDLQESEMAPIVFMLPGLDKIFDYFKFSFNISHSTKCNFTTYKFVPENNTMIIFVSSIPHSVEETRTDIARYCLGSNYFVSGRISHAYKKSLITLRVGDE